MSTGQETGAELSLATKEVHMWQISKTRIWKELEQEFDWVKRMSEVP